MKITDEKGNIVCEHGIFKKLSINKFNINFMTVCREIDVERIKFLNAGSRKEIIIRFHYIHGYDNTPGFYEISNVPVRPAKGELSLLIKRIEKIHKNLEIMEIKDFPVF